MRDLDKYSKILVVVLCAVFAALTLFILCSGIVQIGGTNGQ